VSDTYGRPIPSFELNLTDRDHPERSVRFKDATKPTRIPFGFYTLEGTASRFHPFRREIIIQERKLLVRVAFSPGAGGDISGESTLVHEPLVGRVLHIPAHNGSLWIRYYSIFGLFIEAELPDSGQFRITAVPNGDYFVAIFDGTKLLAVKRVTMDILRSDISIDLATAGVLPWFWPALDNFDEWRAKRIVLIHWNAEAKPLDADMAIVGALLDPKNQMQSKGQEMQQLLNQARIVVEAILPPDFAFAPTPHP
jgi:hypothetical protein